MIGWALDIRKGDESMRQGGRRGGFLFRFVGRAKGLVDLRNRVAIGQKGFV